MIKDASCCFRHWDQSFGRNEINMGEGAFPLVSVGMRPVRSIALNTASSHAFTPLDRFSLRPRISPVGKEVTSTSATGFPLTCSVEN